MTHGPGDDDDLEELREEDPEEYWSEMEARYGRDDIEALYDPNNPDPGLGAYLNATDSSWSPKDVDLDWDEY